MNRIKMFFMAVACVLVILILASNTSASNKTLQSDGELYIESATSMFNNYDNVFCVEHGQDLTANTFKIKASIHIRGRKITLRKWNKTAYKNGEPLVEETFDAYTEPDREIQVKLDGEEKTVRTLGYRANKFAAIFYTDGLENGGKATWSNDVTISAQQLTVWYYWNNLVNALPEDGPDGPIMDWGGASLMYSGMNNLSKLKNEYKYYSNGTKKSKYDIAKANMEKVEKVAENGDYSIDLYYLDCGTASWQALILADKPNEIMDVNVEKVWDDNNNRDGKRPDSIRVELYKNGTKTNQTRVLNENNNWKDTFTGLEKYNSNGTEIDYSIEEILPEENSEFYEKTDTTITGSAAEGFKLIKLTNTHQAERIKLAIEKQWDDMDDFDEYRPESITVKLKRTIGTTVRYWNNNVDGNWVSNIEDGKAIVLSEENNWSYLAGNFYKYYEGEKIEYTFEEDVPLGYTDKITITDPQIIDGVQVQKYILTNTHTPNYEGYIEISGRVWVDRPDGKANDINGVFESDEFGLEGIQVILKNSDGTDFLTGGKINSATTASDGTYSIKVNYDTDSKVYKLDEDPNTKQKLDEDPNTEPKNLKDRLKDAYVEFIYDGMKYTTVNPLDSNEIINYNKKVVKENNDEVNKEGNKIKFDYKGIEPETVTSYTLENIEDYNQAVRNANQEYGQYKLRELVAEKYVSTAIEYEDQRKTFDKNHSVVTTTTAHPDNWTDKNFTAKTEKTIMSYYNDQTTTRAETIKYCNGDGTCIRTNREGAWGAIKTENYTCTDPNCTAKGHQLKTFEVDVSLIENVNLGLFKREQPDVAIVSDLNDVFVTMDGQEYTYYYNKIINNPKDADVKVQFQNDDGTNTYRRPINPADIAYIQDNDLLKVLITYQVRVLNQSNTLPITVNSIINVYDSEYTIESIRKGNADVGYKKSGIYESTQFNEIILNNLNIKVDPQGQAKSEDVIWITYSVSRDAIKGLLNKEATLSNAVEIHTYSTSYGEDTLYAEQRMDGRRNGDNYGGYDYDSHPGNSGMYIAEETYTYTYTDAKGQEQTVEYKDVDVLKATKNEDDDYIAPSLILCKDEEKTLSGNVWVDSSNQIELGDGIYKRLGDGKNLEGTEIGLANAKVELYKVNDDDSIAENPADLYKIEVDGAGNATRVTKPAIAYTDENGNYSFGGNGYSVVTDRYIIKFTYGDGIIKEDGTTISSTIGNNNENKVNARNFKSTIIDGGTALYNVFRGEGNDEWHLNIEKGYSVAVDDINVRLGINDLQYSNFENIINMVAYSKPFKMQVEFDPSVEKVSEVNDDGTTAFGHNLDVFDFGIVERARENIIVNKSVDDLYFTNSLKQTVTQGNPEVEILNYVKSLGFNRENSRTATDKVLSLEYDSELMHNSEISVRYKVTVENNSEVEFDYYLEGSEGTEGKYYTEYYYFGTNEENAPIITSSVNYLVDYIDRDVGYTWENPENWAELDVNGLCNEQGALISDVAKERLSSNKYKIYVTTMFSNLAPGQKSEPQYAKATKTLTNNGENEIEDHIEILQLDHKSARTIKEIVDGKITSKEYRPGNYVPSTDARKKYTDGLVTLWNGDKVKSINASQGGIHEQDDDRVKIVITPGTGITKYTTTYIIAGVIGLMVIVLGVIFIKKKVLIK